MRLSFVRECREIISSIMNAPARFRRTFPSTRPLQQVFPKPRNDPEVLKIHGELFDWDRTAPTARLDSSRQLKGITPADLV